MNKSEQRECMNIIRYINAGMIDTAARAMSALYRAARTKRSQDAILQLAMTYKLVSNDQWVC